MSSTNKIGYRIYNIQEKKFFLQEPQEEIPFPVPDGRFHYEIASELFVTPTDNSVLAAITIAVIISSKPTDSVEKEKIIEYEGSVIFEIVGVDTKPSDKNPGAKVVGLPDKLIEALTSVSYSTCRGIIYSRCGSSSLRHLHIPIINPSNIVPVRAEE